MTTFTAAKTPHIPVYGSKTSLQLLGYEGQELSKKINEVSNSIKRTESITIRRLILPLEDENEKRKEGLEYYINSLRSEAESTDESEFTVFVINYSWQVWQELSKHFSERGLCFEVPDACPGQNNNFMYTWSKAEHYLECEIFGNGSVEFFYRNRKSGEVWGEDTTLEHGFSTAVLKKATLFVG
jgi:hypothetical protein